MEGVEENRENAEHLRGTNGGSRDLMDKFIKPEHENEEREAREEEEMELSLGLSTNGRFGVDPTRKKLKRSSSVSDVVVTDNSVGNGSNPQARGEAVEGYAPLVRASSMPLEKLRNAEVAKEKENYGYGLHAHSIGVSDPQNQLVKEETQGPALGGSSSRQFLPEPLAERPAIIQPDSVATDEEPVQSTLIDMPYVSTRGSGPDHNKIEGFLYRYKRAEDVKIVCVCHGLFLSPAEFVKHGGGGDVAYPLKHIVVSPFPLD